MNCRCAPGDLACFIPPARANLCGIFVTVLRFEPAVSALLSRPVWWVRTSCPVPDEFTGMPITEGFALDEALKPIRPPATDQQTRRTERVPDSALA